MFGVAPWHINGIGAFDLEMHTNTKHFGLNLVSWARGIKRWQNGLVGDLHSLASDIAAHSVVCVFKF